LKVNIGQKQQHNKYLKGWIIIFYICFSYYPSFKLKGEGMANENNKVILDYPIFMEDGKGGQKEIKELIFNGIQIGALRGIKRDEISDDGSDPGTMIPLIASSTRIPISTAEQIDFRDIDKIMEKITPFLPKSPVIGKK